MIWALGRFVADAAAQLSMPLKSVLHLDSLLSLAGLALLLGLTERTALLATEPASIAVVLVPSIWAVYFYLVLRKAAGGSNRPPRWSNYRDAWDTLVYPLMQGAVIGMWYWGPLVLAVRRTIGLTAFFRQNQLRSMDFFREPRAASYLLLLAELVYLPPALILSSVRRGLLRFFDPTYAIGRVTRVPREYAVAFAALQALVLASFLVDTLAALLQQVIPIPVAAPVLGHLIALWVPLAQARLLGGFAYRWRAVLVSKESMQRA